MVVNSRVAGRPGAIDLQNGPFGAVQRDLVLDLGRFRPRGQFLAQGLIEGCSRRNALIGQRALAAQLVPGEVKIGPSNFETRGERFIPHAQCGKLGIDPGQRQSQVGVVET